MSNRFQRRCTTLCAILVFAAALPTLADQPQRVRRDTAQRDQRQSGVHRTGSLNPTRTVRRDATNDVDRNRARIRDDDRLRDRDRDRDRGRDRDRRPVEGIRPGRPGRPDRPVTLPARPPVIGRPVHRPNRRPPTVRPIPYGTVLSQLPRGYRTTIINNQTYYFWNGHYYVPDRLPGRWVCVRPPIGVQVSHVPDDFAEVLIGGLLFYVVNDVFFDGNLNVVDVPIGGTIYNLPPGYQVNYIGGNPYYVWNNGYYQPCFVQGRTGYVRIERPIAVPY